jgi:hypothetical protein
MKQSVLTVLVLASTLCAPATSLAAGPSVRFTAWGFICATGASATLVDSMEQPDCKERSGLRLGTQPTLIRQRTTRTTGGFRVSAQPVQITGTVLGKRVRITRVTPSTSRSQRRAAALSTIEVPAFSTGSIGRAPRTRADVFALLPEFAAVAPNAVVRTARALGRDGTFWHGAQIRDSQLSALETEALRGTAARLSIPIIVQMSPLETVPTTCAGIAAAPQEFTDSPARAVDLVATAVGSPTLCDELSQVQIISAPIVSAKSFPSTADTVVDASVRLIPG